MWPLRREGQRENHAGSRATVSVIAAEAWGCAREIALLIYDWVLQREVG